MTHKDHFFEELVQELGKTANDSNLLKAFLEDLLTPGELREIALRWQIIKQLNQGIPQRQIAKNLDVSIATVTRGSKELSNKHGGFKRVLERINSPEIYKRI